MNKISIKKLKEDWLKELSILGYSRFTVINYRADLDKLGKEIDCTQLRNIVLNTLAKIENPRSRSRALSCYKHFARWLVDNNHIEADFVKNLPPIRVPKTLIKVAKIQLKPIYNRFTSKNSLYATIIETLEKTGMRVGELSGLTLNSLKEDSIIVFGKGSKEREIPCSKELSGRIRKELTKHGHFPSTSQIWRITKRYAGCNPYNFRHDFASRLAKNKESAYTIAAVLGHSSVLTSQIYVNLVSNDLRKAVKEVNEKANIRNYCTP